MQCFTPRYLRQHNIEVPCGYCPACVNRRASGWSFRLAQEERHSTSAYFVTLTYDNDHVPASKNNYLTLKKKHVQLYFKNLRKRHDTTKFHTSKNGRRVRVTVRNKHIKYFAVGEYGGKFSRPHYHAIIFNADVAKVAEAWVDSKGQCRGSIHIGYVSYASIGYCMKYISKPAKVGKHKRDDRIKEFSLQSKGLGLCYLTEKVIKWHRATTDRMYVNLDQGKKAAMPRYYKERIWSKQEREVIGLLSLQRTTEKEVYKLMRGEKPNERDWIEAVKASFRAKGIEYKLDQDKKEKEYATFTIPSRWRAA